MDVMTTNVITVDPETSVRALATLLSERAISGVPVVDRDNRLVGIATEGDLLHRAETGTERRTERRRRRWLDAFATDQEAARDYVKSHGRKVGEIMTREVIAASPGDSILEMLRKLEHHDISAMPVVEQGATSRQLYMPHGAWYDFWTGERHEGGREISRKVDLETTPLYVRAGSILPLGPVKQYTDEKVDEPLTISICPGADASFLLYEDDGGSFNYRKGEWMGVQMNWNDSRHVLTLRLANGSKMLPPLRRNVIVNMGNATRPAVFSGHPLDVRL